MAKPGSGGYSQKRIHKETVMMTNNPPPGTKLCQDRLEATGEFVVEINGAQETLYGGELFYLLFKFGDRYPFESPQVVFIGNHIPVHPHVYSNGHICLSILTDDWSPALSVESVCLSVLSMLSSCTEKKRPPDNAFYVRTCSSNPKDTKWWFHGITYRGVMITHTIGAENLRFISGLEQAKNVVRSWRSVVEMCSANS